jgi:hypothetical protein
MSRQKRVLIPRSGGVWAGLKINLGYDNVLKLAGFIGFAQGNTSLDILMHGGWSSWKK